VYPALAVLQELEGEPLEILWVGGEGGMEQDLVGRAGFELKSIPAAGLHGVGFRSLPGNIIKIGQGYLAARKLLKSFSPDALFFTGGFVAAPFALAAGNIPTLAFVPDIKPGFALRLMARFADRIALVAQASKKYFRDQSRLSVSGYPMRKELAKWDKNTARKHFALKKDLKTLLVFGGSKGAQSINNALHSSLQDLLPSIQILHISGANNWRETEAIKNNLPAHLAKNYHCFPYLHEDMGAALAAADLVLSRAGASTMGEFPLFSLPAILVPIPMESHIQHLNAKYLEKKGAILVLPDHEMSEKLSPSVMTTIVDEAKLTSMSSAMRKLARPNAAKDIAHLLRAVVPARQKDNKAA
jgi:UDP-N-acetylglucosamine--N-acetylmuramyl-(pentapeptide) pyrophosphoryl-undecaprenol N-acetylglucosamine transferase